MKKLLALVLVLIITLPTLALADTYSTESYGFMRVDGCKEWISLRKEPSVRAERILKIPLGAMVTLHSSAASNEIPEDFACVTYGGKIGYVLRKYLCDRDSKYDLPMYAVHCEDFVSLHKYADTDSNLLEKIPSGDELTVMCYGFTFTDESPYMARALFSSDGDVVREGFVNGDFLCILPENGSVKIQSASLHVNQNDGELFVQTLSDRDALDALEQMILRAKAGDLGNCPIGALLSLTLSNGRTIDLTCPTDGCGSLIAQNACIFNLEQEDADRFWKLFDQAKSIVASV